MNWNDERVEQLRKLWADGLSASQIASTLGGVSRNAVIGKVHRLKLSSRGRATAAPARTKKTPKAAVGTVTMKAAVRSSGSVQRSMPASIGATALQVQFDAEPVVERYLRPVHQNVVVPISRRLRLVELAAAERFPRLHQGSAGECGRVRLPDRDGVLERVGRLGSGDLPPGRCLSPATRGRWRAALHAFGSRSHALLCRCSGSGRLGSRRWLAMG